MPENVQPSARPAARPRGLILRQPMMNRVLFALSPIVLAGVYFFGWYVLAVLAIAVVTGLVAEGLFTLRRGEPISSAVLVTAFIYALILPPTVPPLVVAAGMAFAVVFAKMVFGGWARNVFNPAMVGRCFVYVCFPNSLTGAVFGVPAKGLPGGFARWLPDAVTAATPMVQYKAGQALPSWSDLILGYKAGSIGETAAAFILLGGLYLLATRTARWQPVVACFLGEIGVSAILHGAGVVRLPWPHERLMMGGFLFGTFFMLTDPISSARSKAGLWISGAGTGILAVLISSFSIWAGGFMFALVIMNSFNPLIDVAVNAVKDRRKGLPAGAAR